MTEHEIHAKAALNEMQAITDWLVNRCSEHAQRIGVLEFHIQGVAAELMELKKEQTP